MAVPRHRPTGCYKAERWILRDGVQRVGDEKSFVISGHRIVVPTPAPGLYLVATPIGNLKDITLRALEILAGADLVLCEDTRHSARLLEAYAIRTRAHRSTNTMNAPEPTSIVDAARARGTAIALISDAGTPLAVRPRLSAGARGARSGLAGFCRARAPRRFLAALTGAGLPTDAFLFRLFAAQDRPAQQCPRATCSPHRNAGVLRIPAPAWRVVADMAEVFGADRQAVVALELTKRFERFEAGTLARARQRFTPM